MRVGELAESLAITPDTVRYYTRVGYLMPKKIEPMVIKNMTRTISSAYGLF
ncbi:MAG: MerR family transcriptional regulator [Motiliproteus sp.]|nr:MerR family transcriptional regulator [Motiliproteus sp.]MCW9053399.1 MerR family transcriptional regulator [Motiliproteus sp.]